MRLGGVLPFEGERSSVLRHPGRVIGSAWIGQKLWLLGFALATEDTGFASVAGLTILQPGP